MAGWSRLLRLGFAIACLCLAFPGLLLAQSPQPIAIGFYMPVVRDYPRKDVEVTLRFWVDEMTRSLGLSYKPIRFYEDMEEIRRDMQEGKINFMVASSMGVVGHIPQEELRNGFTSKSRDADYLLFVVRKEAGITRPRDLAGRRVTLVEGDELSRVYLETLMLKDWGRPGWDRLASLGSEQKSSKLVMDLFFGRADMALIELNAYEAALALNPQIGQRLQVLDAYTFKGKFSTVGLFSSKLPAEDRERIIESGLKLNGTPRGRQVLAIYHAEDMVRCNLDDLIPYRQLWQEHNALMAAYRRKGGG